MSYFTNGIIYIIVPTLDVSEEMINNMKKDFNSTSDSLRKSLDQSLTLFKVKTPISATFNGYKWFNQKDILIELKKTEWN